MCQGACTKHRTTETDEKMRLYPHLRFSAQVYVTGWRVTGQSLGGQGGVRGQSVGGQGGS